jgi:hypothetical protein
VSLREVKDLDLLKGGVDINEKDLGGDTTQKKKIYAS